MILLSIEVGETRLIAVGIAFVIFIIWLLIRKMTQNGIGSSEAKSSSDDVTNEIADRKSDDNNRKSTTYCDTDMRPAKRVLLASAICLACDVIFFFIRPFLPDLVFSIGFVFCLMCWVTFLVVGLILLIKSFLD